MFVFTLKSSLVPCSSPHPAQTSSIRNIH